MKSSTAGNKEKDAAYLAIKFLLTSNLLTNVSTAAGWELTPKSLEQINLMYIFIKFYWFNT